MFPARRQCVLRVLGQVAFLKRTLLSRAAAAAGTEQVRAVGGTGTHLGR